MLLYPDGLDLYMNLSGQNLWELCQLVLPLLSEVRLPPIQEWEIPLYSVRRSQDLEQQLEELRANNPKDKNPPVNSQFVLDDNIVLFISQSHNIAEAWSCKIFFYIKRHHTHQDLQTFLNSAIDLCRRLLHQNRVYSAIIKRQGGSGRFIPAVPIIDDNNHLILTTKSEVEQSYDYPEVFWNAGWSSIEQFGEQYLLLRCLDKLENLSFLQAVYDSYWHLARAAKAGLIKYYHLEVQPEEEELFWAGEARLNLLGYLPEEQMVEYTCYVEPDEHIQGWEIYELRDWIREGTLLDGRPIKGIRVVFPNQEMAEREKRPLLDIRAKVWYYNSVGETEEITE